MGDVTTLWALRTDGSEFPIEASISQTAEGGRHLYTVILHDISLRVQAQKESEGMRVALDATQARLGAIVDSAMDAIITVDEEQKIVLFNRAAEQLFRVRRDETLGARLDRLIPARFRGAHRGHIERVRPHRGHQPAHGRRHHAVGAARRAARRSSRSRPRSRRRAKAAGATTP